MCCSRDSADDKYQIKKGDKLTLLVESAVLLHRYAIVFDPGGSTRWATQKTAYVPAGTVPQGETTLGDPFTVRVIEGEPAKLRCSIAGGSRCWKGVQAQPVAGSWTAEEEGGSSEDAGSAAQTGGPTSSAKRTGVPSSPGSSSRR